MTNRRNHQMAPYFVQMREFERRLIRSALEEANGKTSAAAIMLGVTKHYLHARAKFLGGVIGAEPRHEPPGRTKEAWANTHNLERSPRQPKASTETESDA